MAILERWNRISGAALMIVSMAAAVQAEEPVVVRGTVTDESGQPVAGAIVALDLRRSANEAENWSVTARSDSGGQYALSIKLEWVKLGAYYHSRTVWCYQPGKLIEAASAYQQVDRGNETPLDFILRPGSETTFEFRTPEGKPLRDAALASFHYKVANIDIPPDLIIDALDARTDAHGILHLPCCEQARVYSIRLRTGDWGTQAFYLEQAETPRPPVLTLAPTGKLRITLTGGDMASRAGALFMPYSNSDARRLPRGEGKAVVDADGVAVIEQLAAGGYQLMASNAKGADFLPKIPRTFEVQPGETTELEVPLVKAVKVTGSVVAEGADQPVVGAYVSVGYGVSRQSQNILTGPDGTFETCVLPGTVRTQAIILPKPFSHWIRDRTRQAATQVAADATEVRLPPIYLLEPKVVSGKLVDERGQPLPGRRLTLKSGDEYIGGGQTDDVGKFEARIGAGATPDVIVVEDPNGGFRGTYARIDSQDPMVISVRRSGLPWNVEVSESPTPPEKLTAPEIDRGADDPDRPRVIFARNVVILGGKTGDYIDAQEYLQSLDRPEATMPYFAATRDLARDPEGYEEARLWVRAMRQLIGFRGGTVRRLDTRRSAVFDELRLGDSWPPEHAETVHGVVLTPTGEPAAGAQVVLLEPPPLSAQQYSASLYLRNGALRDASEHEVAYTDQDGRFEHLVTAPDQYGVMVFHPEGFAMWQRSTGGDSPEPIKLDRWARIVTTLAPNKGNRQSTSIGPALQGFAGNRHLSMHEFSQRDTLRHEFPAVPPGMRVILQRSYQTESGMGVAISPSVIDIQTEPGTTYEVEFGPLTEADKRDIEANLKRYGPN
ncbi:Nickel uptake substrate-specific transmembrane region [Posidoniimonas corsicana]|uniref:Nickel uptake substrate-specific transmembrane region n=1 Tax=Posidoniimonas corsicana TaxID=1938618 RepID=A0A5C5V548_9BACT|nr:carboxypeptidase-like regulatory domain-containing protein [Posidoniimonas corsicana]TWT33461.1 Nickel uptake substrate-specific transmembrane region [Posidoniimonas corsicana]